ncbi:MAG: hypothetical protein IPK50_12055 [Fibrobacterota bacterium]|nr:MAG: hypothetical protein IPK50_12055 [Fibrobacterota bacterium]
MFVSAFAFLAGCKDGTDTREEIPKDSIHSNAIIQENDTAKKSSDNSDFPIQEIYLQNPRHLEFMELGENEKSPLAKPLSGERFSFCASPWISNNEQNPGIILFAASFDYSESQDEIHHPSSLFDGTPLQRDSRVYFSPVNFALTLSSNLDASGWSKLCSFEHLNDNDIDYIARTNKPIPKSHMKEWDLRLITFYTPNAANPNPGYNSLDLFYDPSSILARFHTWILLPDRALGPIETRIGSDSTTFLKDLEERNRTAPPRDRLPPEYQKDQRTWVEQSEDLHVIQPGIHLDMVRTKGGTKLALKYRLPWLRQDSVHLDLDPYVLQGMEVPKGIKEIRLVITSPHGNRDFKIAVPAHPLGDGTCAGSFLINPKSMLANFDIRVYSVFAVTNGQLAGPLMAERNGVHWLQPGLPKPKLRTKAWDPAEEKETE